MPTRLSRLALPLLAASLLAACAQFPITGPMRKAIEEIAVAAPPPGAALVQVVDVDNQVAQQLLAQRTRRLFSETLAGQGAVPIVVGAGDFLEVSIWEAPPATLFVGGSIDSRSVALTARATVLPDQLVDNEGTITVPFAGRLHVAGKTTQQIEAEIAARLKGKANQPQVIVRQTRNASSMVTVVGEVANAVRMPLSPSGERLLDALAAAGGVRQPVNKMTLQVTRGKEFHALPLDLVIQDPRQNIPLRAGDVVTALFQPLSFTALGATGKNEEINFEAQGINLAQALARAGGLLDNRSDAQGVFVFRLERPGVLAWPRQPVTTTPEGLVPVVYRVDLRDPHGFFVMQSFAINNKDVVYVSNAPVAELQKFLNLVFTITYPVLNTIQIVQ